jgi:hypothetical protein
MWLENRCYRSDEAWMMYQSYPVEASLITLVVSLLNALFFWPQQTMKRNAVILMNLLVGTQTSAAYSTSSYVGAAFYSSNNSTSATTGPVGGAAAGGPSAPGDLSDYKRLMGTPSVFLLHALSMSALTVRDLTMAFYEVVRASVFVAEPGALDQPPFQGFASVLRDTVNICELIVASLSEAFVEVMQTGFRILGDGVMMLIDTAHLVHHLTDMFLAIKKLISSVEDMLSKALLQLLLSLPGLKELCPVIDPIVTAVSLILTQLCSILSAVNSAINALSFGTISIPYTIFCGGSPPNLCNLNQPKVSPLFQFEPSVCTYDTDCAPTAVPTPACMVDGAYTTCRYSAWGGASPAQNDTRSTWVQPCPCNDFAAGAPPPFCNYATGFCQEGPSFFGPPLESCPSSGLDLLPNSTNSLRHALCWELPAWRCGASAQRLYGKSAIPGWYSPVTGALDFARCEREDAAGARVCARRSGPRPVLPLFLMCLPRPASRAPCLPRLPARAGACGTWRADPRTEGTTRP